MIERLTESLELGGRRLLRISHKGIRSKRSLHSGFWCHGASCIDLPSWWLSILRDTSQHNELSSRQSTGEACTGLYAQSSGRGLLEFLYPAKTLALMRSLALNRTAHAKKQTQRFSRRYTLRSYTSDATGASTNTDIDSNEPEYLGEPKTALDPDRGDDTDITSNLEILGVESRRQLRSIAMVDEFDILLGKYEQKLVVEGPLDPELDSLFRMASAAGHDLISKRAQSILDLLEEIPFTKRKWNIYDYAIQAALDLERINQALLLHKDAVTCGKGYVSTSSLLHYAIERDEWEAGLNVWNTYCQKTPAKSRNSDIWKGIDTLNLHFLMKQVSNLADFTMKTSLRFGPKNTQKSRDFLDQVVLRALSRRAEYFEIYKQAELIEKLSKMTKLKSTHFNKALMQLLSVGQTNFSEAAIKLYGVMRQDSKLVPPHSILESLMAKLYDMNGQVVGPNIMTIFEDCRLHYTVPKARAFRLAIAAMAYQGDANIVYSLFDEYRAHHPASIDSDTLWDLLYLHFQRAEVEEADKLFQDFPVTYSIDPKLRCWNLMIAMHSRVSDVVGTMRYYNQLLESGTQPNGITFATMMSFHGARGEVEAIENLLLECETRGIAKTFAMIDPLVLAHIRNDDIDTAERLAKKALNMDLSGIPTRMWNYVLNALAIRQDLVKINQTLQTMQVEKVPMDAFTYAALIHGLCVARQPGAAYKVLNVIMDHQNIKPTPFHYALVMSGFVANKDYDDAINVFTAMLEHHKPDFSTQQVAITAAARIDLEEMSQEGHEAQSYTLERAEKLLDEVLGNMDAQELATHAPIMGVKSQRIDEAYKSGYFVFMIHAYGKQKAFDKVARLYNKYVATATTIQPDIEISPPINMLIALMATHIHAKEYGEVERCWHLALEKSEQLARRSDANDISQPGWVLPSRRHILSQPLRYYSEALVLTDRVDEIRPLLKQLLFFGYEPDNRCWNNLVQILCRARREVQAFEICERVLMPDFPGWRTHGFMGGLRKSIPKSYQLDAKMPEYKTLVYLAAAYMSVRDQQAFRSRDDTTMANLEESCPLAVNAIRTMPLIKDDLRPVTVRNKILEGSA